MPSTKSTSRVVINRRKQWLNGDAGASYLRMLASGCPTGGISNMGAGRTSKDQEYLYNGWKKRLPGFNLAAKPGTSLHEKGNALDVSRGTKAQLWMTQGGDPYKVRRGEKIRANEYGWFRTVSSEPWHFTYIRAKDKRRAADLKKRLADLRYPTLKDFQKANKLAADGVDGPLTWAALLTCEPRRDLGETLFRVANYNLQLKRFGGGAYEADAEFIRTILKPSILLAQEAEEASRNVIRAKTALDKTYPLGTTSLFWDSTKWLWGTRIELSLYTAYHGLIGTELTNRKSGAKVVVASVHVRPNDAFPKSLTAQEKIDRKLGDVAQIVAKLAAFPNVVVGGDWATGHARAALERAGYKLVTPWEDTYDKEGVQRLDAIYIRGPLLSNRTGGSIHLTKASDHHGLVANLTVKEK